eukprot:5783990-Alexandrium_andersonii.AAC.1
MDLSKRFWRRGRKPGEPRMSLPGDCSVPPAGQFELSSWIPGAGRQGGLTPPAQHDSDWPQASNRESAGAMESLEDCLLYTSPSPRD